MGGEESAGFTMEGHVPEKDGPLACLLLAELVATSGKTLGTLLQDLFARVGPFCPDRADARLDPALAASMKKRLAENPDTFAGLKVQSHRPDGRPEAPPRRRPLDPLPRLGDGARGSDLRGVA